MDNNIEVLLTMKDEATPVANAFNQTIAQTKSSIGGLGGTSAPMTGLKETLLANKSAMRELSMGAMFLGTSMVGMGAAMSASNNQAAKSAGNILMMVGGIMSAVASAGQFISAITRMTSAINKMNIAQIFANALAGPGGWAKIALGVGIAGAAAYGISKATSTVSARESKASVTVNQHIAGSVVSEREVVDLAHKGLLVKQDRSYSTGINR
jgi:hypothetical protein